MIKMDKLDVVINLVEKLSNGYDIEDECGIRRGLKLLRYLYTLDDPKNFIDDLIKKSGLSEEEFYEKHVFDLEIDIEELLQKAVNEKIYQKTEDDEYAKKKERRDDNN